MHLTVAGLSFPDRSPDNTDIWALEAECLTGKAGPRTDLFVDPDSGKLRDGT